MEWRRIGILALALLAPATPCLAQTTRTSAMIYGGAGLDAQDGAKRRAVYQSAPGGMTFGIGFGGGVRVDERVSVALEWSRTGVMRDTQIIRDRVTNLARQDTLLFGLIRVHQRVNRLVSAEWALGAGFASTTDETFDRTIRSGGFTGGVGASVGAGNLTLVPFAHLYYFLRTGYAYYPGAFPGLAFRCGANIRYQF